MKKVFRFIGVAVCDWLLDRWDDYKVNFNRNGF